MNKQVMETERKRKDSTFYVRPAIKEWETENKTMHNQRLMAVFWEVNLIDLRPLFFGNVMYVWVLFVTN